LRVPEIEPMFLHRPARNPSLCRLRYLGSQPSLHRPTKAYLMLAAEANKLVSGQFHSSNKIPHWVNEVGIAATHKPRPVTTAV
jgi:hypothetical protein